MVGHLGDQVKVGFGPIHVIFFACHDLGEIHQGRSFFLGVTIFIAFDLFIQRLPLETMVYSLKIVIDLLLKPIDTQHCIDSLSDVMEESRADIVTKLPQWQFSHGLHVLKIHPVVDLELSDAIEEILKYW